MTIGRPREFDTETALAAAMRYFWRYGYEATSLQNLLIAMSLSKSSFYQTYGNKNALFKQCLKYYQDTLSTQMAQQLSQADSGFQFIYDVFNGIVEEARVCDEPKGCLLMNSASEFSRRDPEITGLLAQGNNKFIELFHGAVKQAQQEGDIPSDKNSRSLAHFIINNIGGLRNLAKAGASQVVLKDIVATVMRTLM